MELGKNIAYHRKKMNITQDALAKQLDISSQTVSKWETNQSCPDVELLPRLADIFAVTRDELFDRVCTTETQACELAEECISEPIPWENDEKLRAVLFVGRQLVQKSDVEGQYSEVSKKITLEYTGCAKCVESCFSVCCEDVQGDVSAGSYVQCGDVAGDVAAGNHVECGDVGGDVKAGGDVNCGDVRGNVFIEKSSNK